VQGFKEIGKVFIALARDVRKYVWGRFRSMLNAEGKPWLETEEQNATPWFLLAVAYSQNMRDKDRTGFDTVEPKTRGFTVIGIFLFFGATMASLASITLLWRGTALDGGWALNPTAFKELTSLGRSTGILFLLLGATLAVAGVGWFRHRLWGWRLAIGIIATQVLGDFVNCVRGDVLRGGIGAIIAGGLLLFLLRSKIRAAFV
jgi:hypothetical protein